MTSFLAIADLNLPLYGMQFLIAAWVFVLGACFGSFLNVVIYRLPAGLSLGRPKSRCPRCETPLAARDNVPVIGWILLRGKCRYCRLPIAGRYPTVEAICGVLLLTLMFVELFTGAANLPLRHPDHFHGAKFWLIWFTKWDLLGFWLYHGCFLVTGLAVALIAFDGHRSQKKLRVFGVLVGLFCGIAWPELRPVPGYLWPQNFWELKFGFTWADPMARGSIWTGVTFVGLLDGVFGLVGGAFFGRLNSAVVGQNDSPSGSAINDLFLLAGVYCGWQFTGLLSMFVLPPLIAIRLLHWLSRPSFNRSIPLACLTLMTVLLLTWSWVDFFPWTIGFAGIAAFGMDWRIDWAIYIALCLLATVVAMKLPAQELTQADATEEPLNG